MKRNNNKIRVVVAMSPHKSLRDSAGQAGGTRRKRVVVAMSGGVDSSVAAALLKKQGFDVIGVFMHFWAEPTTNYQLLTANQNKCCSIEAEEKARAVAAKLNIPFYVFHFEKEFKKAVVDYFLKEYAAGRTPNPCVVCNQKIKFGLLFEKALGLGMDFLATGHYARLRREFPISNFAYSAEAAASAAKAGQFPNKFQIQNPKYQIKLFKAKDEDKDQSYFLYTLTQNQLRHLLFPIGDYRKSEVYSLAKKWQLPYRERESFDICFIAGKNHNDFLKKYLNPEGPHLFSKKGGAYGAGLKPGKIVDVNGKILGQHQGLSLYTIGQKAEIGGLGPYYVIELNQKNNTLIVTNNSNDPKLYKKSLIVEKVNWVSPKQSLRDATGQAGQEPKLPLKCQVRIRYRHQTVPAVIKIKNPRRKAFGFLQGRQKPKAKNYLVEFRKPQRAITPGQSAVFYSKNDEVLGGGIILN